MINRILFAASIVALASSIPAVADDKSYLTSPAVWAITASPPADDSARLETHGPIFVSVTGCTVTITDKDNQTIFYHKGSCRQKDDER